MKLVSPDGIRRRLLSTITPIALAWAPDASQIYALSIGTDRRPTLSPIALTTGAATTIRTFDQSVAFVTPQNPGVRASVSADGSSLLTTVLRTRSDIWMLEGFDQPHGFLDRFRAPWRSR